MRKDREDAVWRRSEVVQHAAQGATGDLVLHLPGAAPGNAQAPQAPVVQHLAVAAVDPATGAQMRQLTVDHEGPAAGLAGVRAEGQTLVALQLGRRGRHTGALQVGRGGHAQTPVVGQAHADQVRVGHVTHAHRAIKTFVDDVDHPVAEVQRQTHLGVLGQEQRHQRGHMAAPKTGRRGDAHMATGLHPAGTDTGLGAGQVGQQALAIFQKRAAFMGQRDASRGAHQQLHAQALFQRVDAPADHGRGHALDQGRSGQAALGGHGGK